SGSRRRLPGVLQIDQEHPGRTFRRGRRLSLPDQTHVLKDRMTSPPVIPGLVTGRPLEVSTLTVAKSQVNAVGHLRASEYVKLFDDANTAFYVQTGLADENLVHGGTTSFLMDLHTCYVAELRAGETVHIS